MISKKDLEHFECDSIYDFFKVIFESQTNGQRSQTKGYIKNLSTDQWFQFLRYAEEYDHDIIQYCYMREEK